MAGSERRPFPAPLRDARPDVLPSHFISTQNLLVAFGFRCNLACTFCMVEDMLDVRAGVDLDTFRRVARDPAAIGEVRRVVLSGGEATLEPELLDYIAVARSIPGVEHVRIQTNATKLASPQFVQRLLDAGVDELFVSLHGADSAVCEQITQVPGSFRSILNGLANIAATSARLYTNTCIVAPNHRQLAALVDLVAPFKPRGMDFWGLWPRLDPEDRRGLCAKVGDVQPHLQAALARCEQLGIAPVVKWYPRCLLGDYARYQNDAQPTVLIHNDYWEDAPEFACIYENVCAWGRDNPCAGLSFAHIHRLGWEEKVLRPQAKAAAALTAVPEAPSEDLGAWAARLGLAIGTRLGPYAVRGARRAEDAVCLSLHADRHQLDVYLYSNRQPRPAFGATSSFLVVHSRIDAGAEPAVGDAMAALLEVLRRHDHGGLALPGAVLAAAGDSQPLVVAAKVIPDGGEAALATLMRWTLPDREVTLQLLPDAASAHAALAHALGHGLTTVEEVQPAYRERLERLGSAYGALGAGAVPTRDAVRRLLEVAARAGERLAFWRAWPAGLVPPQPGDPTARPMFEDLGLELDDVELLGLRLGTRRLLKREGLDGEALAALERAWRGAGLEVAAVPLAGGRAVAFGGDAALVQQACTWERQLVTDHAAAAVTALGAALGYPSCCVERFARLQRTDNLMLAARLLPPVPAPPAPAATQWLNFELSVLSHAPCRPDCGASLKLASTLLAGIAARAPAFPERWAQVAAVHAVDHRGRLLLLQVDGDLVRQRQVTVRSVRGFGAGPLPDLTGATLRPHLGGLAAPDLQWWAPLVADHRRVEAP